MGVLIGKRARIEGFLVSDFSERFGEARRWLSDHLKAGRLKQRLHVIDGLERAPEGLAMLFRGENTGKLVVRVAGEDWAMRKPPSGRAGREVPEPVLSVGTAGWRPSRPERH